MKLGKSIKYILLTALILIISNSLLEYAQAFIFGGRHDFELMYIFLLYTLILFQWVFILAITIFYLIRSKLKSNNYSLMVFLGAILSFAFYAFYWLGANSGDLGTLRLAIINSIIFGLIMESMYRRIIINEA